MKVSTKWTTPCMDTAAHHDSAKTLWPRQRQILDSNPAKSTSLSTWNDQLLSFDHRLVRDMAQRLKPKFLLKKVGFLTKFGEIVEIWGRKVVRTTFGVHTHHHVESAH